jgi:hypothetical protein
MDQAPCEEPDGCSDLSQALTDISRRQQSVAQIRSPVSRFWQDSVRP